MQFTFTNEVWYWRGPSPFYFLKVPESDSRKIKEVSKLITYGWGVIPAKVKIGETEWTTSLIPKDGLYLVPLKDAIRKRETLEIGDSVEALISLTI